ncbi:MAG: dipicolinic acid synthetase, subunit [Bacilli bacterium]|nr:dipicolinic acid synthetase, subunit [Bacilli bacterium]
MVKGATSVWVDKKVAFIGGDARQLEVIEKVAALGAEVIGYGFNGLKRSISGFSLVDEQCSAWEQLDVMVLPVTGVESGGQVLTKFQPGPIVLPDSFWARIPRGCLVFTGISKPYLKQLAENCQWRVISLMDLDEVAILNSIPSAEGAIQMAMENTPITIHGSNCAVLGFGRCGTTLARTLHGMGARVFAGARKAADLARIREMGLSEFPFSDLSLVLPKMDIVFNTVPTVLLTRQQLEQLSIHTVIIDIASSPGGVDYFSAEELGIKALLAPSLPGIVAPRTAGQILADTIVRLVEDLPDAED